MPEEMDEAALVVSDEEFDIALGDVLPEGESHSFINVLSDEELEDAESNGMKVFLYDMGRHYPTRMIFDGENWLDEFKPKSKEDETPAIASMDGLLSVAEIMQSELEATVVAMAAITDYDVPSYAQVMAIGAERSQTPREALDALFGKLLLGRMALGGQNIYDVAAASRTISDEAAAEAPTIFYDEQGEVSDGGGADAAV